MGNGTTAYCIIPLSPMITLAGTFYLLICARESLTANRNFSSTTTTSCPPLSPTFPSLTLTAATQRHTGRTTIEQQTARRTSPRRRAHHLSASDGAPDLHLSNHHHPFHLSITLPTDHNEASRQVFRPNARFPHAHPASPNPLASSCCVYLSSSPSFHLAKSFGVIEAER